MSSIQEAVEVATDGVATEREKAVALHDYVRDQIKFGFNRYFDMSRPDHTLDLKIGHCNAKSELMVALFREAGLEAHHHFVVLPREIIQGVIPPSSSWLIPKELSHCYTEVKLEGNWCKIDSYILDMQLMKVAQMKLSQKGLTYGYGSHICATSSWDGRNNAFSQFEKNIMLEDHGRIENVHVFYRSREYRNKVFGVSLNLLFRFLGRGIEIYVNSHIEKLRKQHLGQ